MSAESAKRIQADPPNCLTFGGNPWSGWSVLPRLPREPHSRVLLFELHPVAYYSYCTSRGATIWKLWEEGADGGGHHLS